MTVGRICLHERFFSVELELREARKRISDELLNFCIVTEPAKTTFGKMRKTYTGKLFGKQDDLSIAIQLAIIGQQKFYQDSKASSLFTQRIRTHIHNLLFHVVPHNPPLAICHSTRTSAWTTT